MKKVLWLDTETTGVNPVRNCLIQIGYMVEIESKIVAEGSILSRPFPDSVIDQGALDVHGKTVEEIQAYPPAKQAFNAFVFELGQFCNQYDKTDKFIMAGYNVRFDNDMLRSYFNKCGSSYFGSWFFWPCLDVVSFLALRVAKSGLALSNFQLKTVCEKFRIPLKAHDALADIRATRELFQMLTDEESFI